MNDAPHALCLPYPKDPVALLVDGENLSPDHGEEILALARRYGVPTVRRAYGKEAHLAGWGQFGFRPMPVRQGKNAADLLLSVEAMVLALREGFHTLIIAASDRDYIPLVEQLRELGHEVIGIGGSKTAPCYTAVCTAFHELAIAAEAPAPAPMPAPAKVAPKPPAPKAPPLSALDGRLREKLSAHPGGVSMVTLGNLMKGATVRDQTQGCATWRSYLGKHPGLYRIEGKGAESLVRWIGPVMKKASANVAKTL